MSSATEAATSSSCFEDDDGGGDEELLEVRGLLAYIDTQEQMIKLQAGELKDLREQLQKRDLMDIERNAWVPPPPAAATQEMAVQTDAVEIDNVEEDDDDDDDIQLRLEQHEEALHRAGRLAVELAESHERADLLQEDLITTKQQLQACQDKLREMILGHNSDNNNSDKPGMQRFRLKRDAKNHLSSSSTLKSFFMRPSSANPATLMAMTTDDGTSGGAHSVQTMPLPSKPVMQASSLSHDEQNNNIEVDASTIYTAPADVLQTASDNSTFRFVTASKRREPIANVSFEENEIEKGHVSISSCFEKGDDEDICYGTSDYLDEQALTYASDDNDELSYKSYASNNHVTIQKLDEAIEDPRPWKQVLKQRNEATKARIIQQVYRKYATKKRQASVLLQCWWRMTVVRVKYQQFMFLKRRRHAAIVLQCFARTVFALDYYNSLHAAVIIQTKWRSSVQRRKYKKIYNAALIIQPFIRSIQAMDRFYELRDQRRAAVEIQKQARGFLLRRDWARTRNLAVQLVVDMTAALTKTDAANHPFSKAGPLPIDVKAHHQTVLQATKQLIALTKGCPFLFGYSASAAASSTCLLNPLWKMVERNVSVVVLQKTWRRFVQQQQWEACRKDAIMIQAAYRRYQKQHLFICTRKKAILIQNRMRRCMAKALLLVLAQEKVAAIRKEAATKIQSHMRGYPLRCQYALSMEALKRVQTRFRVYSAQLELARLRKENLAATVIQTWAGLVYVRNQHRTRFLNLSVNSKTYHSFSALDFGAETATSCAVVSTETERQSIVDDIAVAMDAMRRKEEIVAMSYEYEADDDESASLWEESFDTWDDAAIYVHAFFNGLEKHSRLQAARLIQQHWRSHLAVKTKRSSAAHWIQCYWRERLSVKHGAASVIQRLSRTRLSTKSKAAAVIQSYWRERAATRLVAATLVQMVWRGTMTRVYFARYQASASRLDSFLKGEMPATMQAESLIRSKIMQQVVYFLAALKVQRWWLDMIGFILPEPNIEDDTCMVIEFDPHCAADFKDLALDKSMSFDQSCIGSLDARQRLWKEKTPKVWNSLRDKANVAMATNRTSHSNPKGYISMEEDHDRYAMPAANNDRCTLSPSVVVSDDEEKTKPSARSIAKRLAKTQVQASDERKPILANFPTLKLSLETKKKLKRLKSSLSLKKKVDLTDPKTQRKLAEIDGMNWAEFDFRDKDLSIDDDEFPIIKPTTKSSRSSKTRHARKTSTRSYQNTLTNNNKKPNAFPSDVSLGSRRGNLPPLQESPAEVSHCESDESFLMDKSVVVGSNSLTEDRDKKNKENVKRFKATFSTWSTKADQYESSGLADVLEDIDAFRVVGKEK